METELLERITINPAIYNASQLENSLIQLNVNTVSIPIFTSKKI
jgi:hypothetical protein